MSTYSFETSQTYGYPSYINFVDTSVDPDPDIDNIRIYLFDSSGQNVVSPGNTNNYEDFYAESISIELLNKDMALGINVEWRIGNSVVAYSSKTIGFTLYNETFDYQLTQLLAANPNIINDNNFFANKSKLRTCIDSGNQAILMNSDIYNAQIAYDQATNLRLNSQYFFNANS